MQDDASDILGVDFPRHMIPFTKLLVLSMGPVCSKVLKYIHMHTYTTNNIIECNCLRYTSLWC